MSLSPRARIREAWERFLLYLPFALMGVLALGTYWLVRSTPVPASPAPRQAERHEPDYYMEGFSVRTFDAAGSIRSEVLGSSARHYPDTPWLEIDAIRIRSFDTRGRLTTASADRGLSTEDGSEVKLLGHASVVREAQSAASAASSPRLEYRGEFLHAFITTERVVSDQPVELLHGQDRFTADRLDYDQATRVLQLQGRVRGTLVPGRQP